jgi:hypothetical protein
MQAAEKRVRLMLDCMGVRVIKKSESKLMRFIGKFSRRFMTDYITTFRIPGGPPTIAFPDDTANPYEEEDIILHECVHVVQFRPWYGPYLVLLLVTVFPLPVLLSGRWHIEKRAYLRDIQDGSCSIQSAAEMLWDGYLWPWPKPWMVKWFQKQLKKQKTVC